MVLKKSNLFRRVKQVGKSQGSADGGGGEKGGAANCPRNGRKNEKHGRQTLQKKLPYLGRGYAKLEYLFMWIR